MILAGDPESNEAIAVAADATSLIWSNDSVHSWFAQSEVSHDFVDAIRSGPIPHNSSSWVDARVNGPGLLSFWWRVSCEGGYDKAVVYLDGSPQRVNWNLVDSWIFVRFNVPPGTHTVRWAYVKDGSETEKEDTAWVDQVRFEPTDEIFVEVEFDQVWGNGEIWLPATEPGKTVLLLTSTNLFTWTTNAVVNTNMIRAEATNGPAQFFRVIVR
jgi:hypothetical protein